MSATAPSGGLMRRLVHAFLVGPLSPLFLVVSAACGVIAVTVTPREEEPQIVVPSADVLVSFPGASAEEVEHLVATPLERLLWQVEGVEHVYSVARRDGAVVTVRFFVGTDRERALVRLQSRIDAHRDRAPPGVAGWIVRPVDIDDVPVLALTLWSPTADEADDGHEGEEQVEEQLVHLLVRGRARVARDVDEHVAREDVARQRERARAEVVGDGDGVGAALLRERQRDRGDRAARRLSLIHI